MKWTEDIKTRMTTVIIAQLNIPTVIRKLTNKNYNNAFNTHHYSEV